ncbi:MAG: glycosyltransferase family 87 protein [Candidatus Binataceae bacterium]
MPAGTRRVTDASHVSTLIVAAAWIAVAAYAVFWIPRHLPGRARDFDFAVYYTEALALAHHDNPYTVDLKPIAASFGFDITPVVHATDPPPFLVMIEPMAATGPARAFWIWTAANVAMLALSLLLLFGIDAAGPRSAALLAAVAIAYPPVRALFFFGQSKMSILLTLAAAMRALERRRDASAGLLLAFASLTRIFPLLMAIFLILRRRWRALGFMIAGIAAGLTLTVAVLGLTPTLDWSAGVRILSLRIFQDAGENVALPAFVSRVLLAAPGGGSGALVEAAEILASIAIFILTCVPTMRARPDDREAGLRLFALWVTASVILSPMAPIYDLVLLLIPLSVIARDAIVDRVVAAPAILAIASVGLMFLVCGSGCLNSVGWIVSYILVRRIGLPIGGLIAEGATLSLFLAYAAAFCLALEPAMKPEPPL